MTVVSSAARRQPTVTEVAKLEAEINQLKRALEVRISLYYVLVYIYTSVSQKLMHLKI